MDGQFSASPVSRQLETPKYLAPENSDAPEVVSSDGTLLVPKWTPLPRPSTPPEVVPKHERSCFKRATICGLVPAVFILLVTLAVVIIAAAVGGGVGGSIAVKNARSEGIAEGKSSCSAVDSLLDTTTAATSISSTSTTSTSESSASPTETDYSPPENVILTLNCPSLTGDRTSTKLDDSHTYYFDTDCGVDRKGDNIDIVAVITYSFEHCLRACGAYNRYDRGDKCVAVTFIADLTSLSSEGFGGNCYLKSGRGERTLFGSSNRNTRVSALLVEDN